MYMSNGYMSVQFMPAQHRHYASGDPWNGTQEEYTETATTFSAYCRTYSINNNTVTHHVEVSSFLIYVGKSLVRNFTFSNGDLILSTPPMLLVGHEVTVQLVWSRVK